MLTVKMEDRVTLPLTTLTVSVPAGTQESSAKTEVCNVGASIHTDWDWWMELTQSSFNECFIFAVCSPACENGGTCTGSYFASNCECPSGYTGDYCQERVAHYNFGENCVCVRIHVCVVHTCAQVRACVCMGAC